MQWGRCSSRTSIWSSTLPLHTQLQLGFQPVQLLNNHMLCWDSFSSKCSKFLLGAAHGIAVAITEYSLPNISLLSSNEVFFGYV